jgi:hypothetical protein
MFPSARYTCLFNFVPDLLRFLVLADRLLGTAPDLDPVAMRSVAAPPEPSGSHVDQNVADAVE